MINDIKSIISEFVEVDENEIRSESNLRSDIGLSSLDLISVATEIESKFGVTISERKVLSLKTVDDLIKCIG
ncbi:MAG: acyl carrier protein [Clostridia bacterium]|nr:acyl carrier protein [Clostridia bacterium]